MFKIAVNNLVQSIGDDVYLPSPSTAASKNLVPLSLVEREGSILPFSHCNDYHTTDFTLDDILVDQNVEFKVLPDVPFCTFNRESTVKVDGALQGSFKDIFDAGVQRVDTITIKAEFGELSVSEVNMQSLLSDLHSRKLNMRHGLVSELSRKKRRALCLVTGVVKTTTETDVIAELNHSFDLGINDDDKDNDENIDEKDSRVPLTEDSKSKKTTGIVDGELKAVHEKNSKRSLHLPAGTVVAYQLMELAVSDTGTVRLMITHSSKGGFHVKSLDEKSSKKSTSSSKQTTQKGPL